MIPIPSQQTKKWSTSLDGDLFGNISRTRNIDFNKKGVISLARKPYALLTETQEINFETPLAILSDDASAFVITTEEMFEIDVITGDFTYNERSTGTPPTFGFQSDATFWQSLIFASGTTTVNSYDAGTWTSRITGLSSAYPHPLAVSEHQQYLAVGNGNTVRLYSTAYALITTCTIPDEHIVTWIRWKGNLLYFGTRNIQGGDARMYLWNGSGTAAQAGYAAGAEWLFSGCVYGSSIVVVSSIGQLLKFSGDGFVPLRTSDGREMNFPVYNSGIPWGSNAAASNLLGKVASRGMKAKGGRIYMVVNAQIEFKEGGTPEDLINFPSGLWVFDPDVGLYHKSGIDHAQRNKVTASSVTADVLTLASSQVFETGDPVYCTAIGSLTGDLDGDMIYYAIKTDSTHLKLAWTPQQAKAGEGITITGTGTASEFLFNVYESVGAVRIERPGPVEIITSAGMPRFNGIEVLFGADLRIATGTTVGAVMSLGMGKNVGSFDTTKIQASAFTAAFSRLFAKFPPLNLASRQIIIKYKIEDRWGVPGRRDFDGGQAVWVNSTSFTVNPKQYDMYSVIVGDEVEFLNRAGAGYTAHITDITVDSATQWTITIDETMPDVVVSDAADFTVDSWVKHKVISTTDDAKAATKGLKRMMIDKKAKWIKLRIELRGYTDIEETHDIEELMLLNSADQNYA